MLASEQEAALLDRRVHVGVLRTTFDHEQLVEELLFDDPFVVAVPSDHRLAQRVALRVADLAGEPIVLYGTCSIESDLVLSLFHGGGIKPEVAFQVQQSEAALGLVAAGMGLTLAPATFSHAPRTGVQFVPLEPAPCLPMRIVYRLHERSPAALAFLKIVREEASTLAGASACRGNDGAL